MSHTVQRPRERAALCLRYVQLAGGRYGLRVRAKNGAGPMCQQRVIPKSRRRPARRAARLRARAAAAAAALSWSAAQARPRGQAAAASPPSAGSGEARRARLVCSGPPTSSRAALGGLISQPGLLGHSLEASSEVSSRAPPQRARSHQSARDHALSRHLLHCAGDQRPA